MKKYKLKDQIVIAEQFFKDKEKLPKGVTVDLNGSYVIDTSDGLTPVFDAQWIVKWHNKTWVLSDYEFRKNYEELHS